jgi:NAD(P)-dependent dehydrogenase (short-subunit alcohol dehydrogenase family)
MGFEGRSYAVLGATGGIGRAVAEGLSGRGARLVLGARSEDPLNELAEAVGAVAHPLDARSFDEVDGLVERAVEAHGGLDGVVNAVGSIKLKPAHITRAAELEAVLATNLTSAFAAVRSGARALRESGGSIVLFSTAAVRSGIPNHEAIAAAKGGVEGLTRAAAATYATAGVRVNAVAPGLTRTPGAERIVSSDSARKASEAMHAVGRLGEPEDVASAVLWLLDPANTWVTGQVLGVDGGLGSLRPAPGQ